MSGTRARISPGAVHHSLLRKGVAVCRYRAQSMRTLLRVRWTSVPFLFLVAVAPVVLFATASSAGPFLKTLPAQVVTIRYPQTQGVHATSSDHARAVWVTIRLRSSPSEGVDCGVVLRHGRKVIGKSGLRGALPGGGVSIAVGVTNLSLPIRLMKASVACTSLLSSSISPHVTTAP
jgi:hypothetical protein